LPLTPFHFGPGAVIRSVAPKWFSLRAFILIQIIIDMETAINIVRGTPRLHTFFHTYFGSTFAALVSLIAILSYNQLAVRRPALQSGNSAVWDPISLTRAVCAVLLGAWSHVLLDSIMHADMTPLSPISDSNALLRVVSLSALHLFCLTSFAVAGVFLGIRRLSRRAKNLPSRKGT
jgi:hypothetical protein